MSNHISNGKADTVNGADAVLDLDALAEAIRDDVRRGVACFRAAGEKLLRAKEECIRQGKPWLRWVKDNLPVTPRTASNWMRLAREVPDQDSPASETVSDTGLRRAIDRIAGKAKRRRAAPPAALPATVAGPSCTLHHGDAVKVMREMQDSSADFIFTDPPYGLGYQDGDRAAALKGYDGEEGRPILNDTRKAANLLFRRSVKQFARLLKPGGVCCVCAPDGGPTQVTAKWAIWLSRYLKVVT